MWKLFLAGVILVAIATAFTIATETDSGNDEGQIAAEKVQATLRARTNSGFQRPLA